MMAVLPNDKPGVEFISCPHLTPDVDGWHNALSGRGDGSVIKLHTPNPDHECHLLLCDICAASVRADVLSVIVCDAINAHFAYTKFGGLK